MIRKVILSPRKSHPTPLQQRGPAGTGARLAAATRAAAPHGTALVELMEVRRLLASTGGTIVLNGRHVEATGTDPIPDETSGTDGRGGDDVMRIERVGTDDVLVTVNNIS